MKIKSLETQTEHYLNRPDISILEKIQQLKDEIVKVSYEVEPNLKLMRFLMKQLNREQRKLKEFRDRMGIG